MLTASAGLTRDKGLRQGVATRVAGGEALPAAVHGAVAQFVDVFTAMGGLMAERATDLLDIERRLVARLVGEPEPGVARPDVPSVLVAADLAPADTAGLDPQVVLALVTEKGGATSHTAIIARQLGIPCVVGVAGALEITAGTHVLVDGSAGTVDPTVAETDAVAQVEVDRAARALAEPGPGRPRRPTGCGSSCSPTSPTGSRPRSAASSPVEGVGLFRTELCFLDRREEPSVDEQATIYAEVLDAFAGDGRYVVVRTLDAGSDKPIAFATLEDEVNPALGVRGLRLAVDNPGLLERQLDGIAEAAGRIRHRDLGDGADGGHRRRGRRSRSRCGTAGSRPASWSRCRALRCSPTGCSRSSTSCRSAPTTSPSTRWPRTGWPPTWRT